MWRGREKGSCVFVRFFHEQNFEEKKTNNFSKIKGEKKKKKRSFVQKIEKVTKIFTVQSQFLHTSATDVIRNGIFRF